MYCFCFVTTVGAVITEAPQNTRAPIGTNVTFTCRGNGLIIWIIGGLQVRSPSRVASLAEEGVFVELGRHNFSEVMMTATVNLNMSNFRFITCRVEVGDVISGDAVNSEEVSLFVYGE